MAGKGRPRKRNYKTLASPRRRSARLLLCSAPTLGHSDAVDPPIAPRKAVVPHTAREASQHSYLDGASLQTHNVHNNSLGNGNGIDVDDEDERSLLQMLQDGMGDALEALLVGDDDGGWHHRQESSCKCESTEDEDEVERVGSVLESLTWSHKLL